MTLARAAWDRHRARHPDAAGPLLVAASVGPYGATRHDGSEYHGRYGLDEDALADFHGPRLAALAAADPDLLACETFPSLLEARAVVRVLRAHPERRAWVSFTCRDGAHTSAGDAIVDCARYLDGEEQVVAMGINCVAPALVTSLVQSMASVSRKPIVVYPNSGELWNAAGRCWEGTASRFTVHVAEWLEAGARWIGGCCRTTPADIRDVRRGVGLHADSLAPFGDDTHA